jgi:hypothetical protein
LPRFGASARKWSPLELQFTVAPGKQSDLAAWTASGVRRFAPQSTRLTKDVLLRELAQSLGTVPEGAREIADRSHLPTEGRRRYSLHGSMGRRRCRKVVALPPAADAALSSATVASPGLASPAYRKSVSGHSYNVSGGIGPCHLGRLRVAMVTALDDAGGTDETRRDEGYYRKRAQELREIAMRSQHSDVRQDLLALALRYEHLAARAKTDKD